MDEKEKKRILQLFADQYNQAIKDNSTVVSPKTDPWDGPKPMAKDGLAITLCNVSVIYKYTKYGVNYYKGFDGRICTWEGLTQIEKEIFNKQNSINHIDVGSNNSHTDTIVR